MLKTVGLLNSLMVAVSLSGVNQYGVKMSTTKPTTIIYLYFLGFSVNYRGSAACLRTVGPSAIGKDFIRGNTTPEDFRSHKNKRKRTVLNFM